ncbi:tyrosine-type recombinase/integrase [Nocardia amamiensis]|uniref:tyrosine-type recombinase/integrase n=1 Tax=Nocardia amamiensis TaxID=404578 RepID=UPI00340250F8
MENNTQDMLGLFSIEIAADPMLAGFTAALADRDDLAVRSRETYLERVGHFLAWLGADRSHDDALHSPTGRDRAVDAYLTAAVEERGVVARTVNLTLTALTVFYTWLGLGAPATPRVVVEPINPRTLGPSEQRALLRAACGPRAFAMIVLGLDAGPRKPEIAALALTGLDLADWPGTLSITDSTGGSRTVPVQPGTRAALVAWLAERRRLLRGQSEQVALFLTEQAPHRRLAVRTVDDAIRAVGADAGLDISPGTLCATAEQRMLRKGLPPAVVAARLGQQAPDRDRVRALLGGAAPHPRNRLALPGSEQLDLFGDIAM